MKRAVLLFFIIVGLSLGLRAQSVTNTTSPVIDLMTGIRNAIEKHLGRPYVWGATGIKSFGCSGFVWRVLQDNGVFIKRTTARKLYMMTKSAPKDAQGNFGTLVFFDDLKHIGIVDDGGAFFHDRPVKAPTAL